MARIAVLGASGYLAHRLVPLAAERSEVTAVSRHAPDSETCADATWMAVDLCDVRQVDAFVAAVAPEVIINAAAINPGQAETFDVNTVGAANVAVAAERTGARLVHISSDIVFAGTQAPYSDSATPDPVNDYGRSKADGETLVAQQCASAVIVRTSLIYGLDRIDRGTAGFLERLRRGEQLSLWADAIRQPVWIDALSSGLLALGLDHPDVSGTLNLAGGQAMSRADFGRHLLTYWGADASGVVDGSLVGIDGQPPDLRLDHRRATELGLPLPGVETVLATA